MPAQQPATRETAPASAPRPFVRPLSELSHVDVAWAGGKGANLGELASAGLPVPGGFVVGAPAFAAFCDESGLRGTLSALLSGLDVDDVPALDAASAQARRLVLETSLPPSVELAVRAAYRALAPDGAMVDFPVAVRSSATAEDTAEASFAGMNESFLNVRGVEAVLEAVHRCWASLFGARTLLYRAQRRLPLAGIDIAVVVQRQIDARRAGVMFTIDPSTGDAGRLVIEGALGLGESVVSGAVSPDRYVVDKDDGSVFAREVHRKRMAVEPLPEAAPWSGR